MCLSNLYLRLKRGEKKTTKKTPTLGKINIHSSTWESRGCRSHLAAAALLTQRCSAAQRAPLSCLSVHGKRAITTMQWHCIGSVWPGTGWKAVLLLRTSPRVQHHRHPRQLPKPPVSSAPGAAPTRRCSHSPLLSRGTGWLWEGWRALTRVPRPPSCHFSVSAENNKHGAMVQSFLLLKNELEILLSCVLLLLPRCPWTENCRIKHTSFTPLWCSPLEKS